MVLEKTLTFLGRAFIFAGVVVFLFVAYQLWGTNLAEARHQNALEKEAAELFGPLEPEDPTVSPGDKPSQPATSAPPNTTPAPLPAPEGNAVAVIEIPDIGVKKTVIEGTGVSDLKRGPGHYLNTPLPGQPGNASIAGHRTTYGAPFNRLQELKNGAVINVRTKQGLFHYKVTGQKIVDPSDVSVLAPTKENRLTLTTCHPKYSAAKRLIITAVLDTSPAPAPTTTTTAAPKPGPTTPTSTTTTTAPDTAAMLSGADLSGTAENKTPVLFWGGLTSLWTIAIMVLASRWKKWLVYLVGTPVFLVLLFVFFENFSLLLPANA
jgi:sortase A